MFVFKKEGIFIAQQRLGMYILKEKILFYDFFRVFFHVMSYQLPLLCMLYCILLACLCIIRTREDFFKTEYCNASTVDYFHHPMTLQR